MINEIQLKNRLLAAYEFFDKAGHDRNKSRICQLAHKLGMREFGVAFAGHFSAGKSRMINTLCGADLLPSSPVPTSANLVRVHSGEEYARVFFRHEKPRRYLAPYDYDMVRGFCKDGDQVTIIELSHKGIDLPEQVVIMDTPGIDSADDAHRLATEDALHMADMIFYVMDYNHVQSELNFSFTRELTKAGKEVYLVINQIDKHTSSELTFDSFKNGIKQAFSAWGVEPAGIYYTSLKEFNHPENQLQELQDMLWARIELRDQLMIDSVLASLQKICDEYHKEQSSLAREELSEAMSVFDGIGERELAALRADYHSLKTERDSLFEDWGPDYDEAVERILSNAYLMPTSTRDLAASYLESCQDDFKVGFFNRQKKTEAERNRRLEIFFGDVKEKARTQIEWHLKTFLLDFARKRGIAADDYMQSVQQMELPVPVELLSAAMRDGAKLTQDGSYVMNYTGNVAEGIKKQARIIAGTYKDKLKELTKEKAQVRSRTIDSQLEQMGAYPEAIDRLEESEGRLAGLEKELAVLMDCSQDERFIISGAVKAHEDVHGIFEIKAFEEEIVSSDGLTSSEGQAVKQSRYDASLPVANYGSDADKVDTEPAAYADGSVQMKAMAEKFRLCADLISPLPGMKRLSGELKDRAERLDKHGFMVTLFGAFSAGKSSFANSLLGERLLPVSPNPTTAAINKIMPVDEEHPHGTVRIKLKDEAMLLADVNHALKAFKYEISSLDEAGELLGRVLADSKVSRQRQKSFLKAFRDGYHKQASRLGKIMTKGLDDFAAYAAEEDKSCFVEWIEVYYDCSFTRQGITLVDTPGADSINARHTDMSFSFIRQSDVVLFVTYYNHAFSRADREFLIQLGRVKDAFQLDKMFFIVNAIDLAENQEEADGVLEYVRQQMKKYGVRKPQLHPLSSQQILKEKLEGETKQYPFEKDFYSFVFNDLTGIVLDAARQEYDRCLKLVDELIEASQEDEAGKKHRIVLLKEHKANALDIVNGLTSHEISLRQRQELSELIFYVKQRTFLRYIDFFREAFNPADIRSGGNVNQMLEDCLRQLLDNIGFDLAQELRATSLRMDNFLQKTFKRWHSNLLARLKEVDREIALSEPELKLDAGLEFETAFQKISINKFSQAMASFKNPRVFFEEGGSAVMAEAVGDILSAEADKYLEQERIRLEKAFEEAIDKSFASELAEMRDELEAFYAGHLSALEGAIAPAELIAIRNRL